LNKSFLLKIKKALRLKIWYRLNNIDLTIKCVDQVKSISIKLKNIILKILTKPK
jgi:hypothetical protein